MAPRNASISPDTKNPVSALRDPAESSVPSSPGDRRGGASGELTCIVYPLGSDGAFRSLAELHLDVQRPAVAINRQVHHVARPLARYGSRQRVVFRNRLPVDSRNKISAHAQSRVAYAYHVAIAPQPGFLRRRTAADLLNQQPARGRQLQGLGQVSGDEYRIRSETRPPNFFPALKS